MHKRTVVVMVLCAVLLSLGIGAVAGSSLLASPVESEPEVSFDIGASTVPFYGPHQAGIETSPQAHATFVALSLLPSVDREGIGRLMRLWTDDAARLTQGEPIIGDSSPQLAENPSDLTITFAFGREAFAKTGTLEAWPIKVDAIPPYAIDRLEPRWNDGDLLLQVAGDDSNTNFHAVHQLLRTAKSFARPQWIQRGFLDAAGVNTGEIGRNLLGQIDGQANPAPGSSEFAERTWMDAPASMVGGTVMVLRRIQFDLEAWDRVSEASKGQVIGRDLASGAPLSGGDPSSALDLEATDVDGKPAIGDSAHARLARTAGGVGIVRRGYNYDDGLTDGVRDVGLIFVSFQAALERFLEIQELLSQQDALNRYTTPIGSALFVVPPGVEEGGWIGQSLFGE